MRWRRVNLQVFYISGIKSRVHIGTTMQRVRGHQVGELLDDFTLHDKKNETEYKIHQGYARPHVYRIYVHFERM